MFRTRFVALFVFVLAASAALAQSPADGSISGNSYVNRYFHLTYAWPTILKAQPIPAADPKNANSYEFLLFSAKQGSQPYGVAVVAQKLGVSGPHSTGVKTASELLDRMHHSLRPGPILSNITRSQKKTPSGLIFEELDYLQNGKPSAVFALPSGAYVVLFKCSAQNAAEFAAMQKSVLALRVAK